MVTIYKLIRIDVVIYIIVIVSYLYITPINNAILYYYRCSNPKE